MAAVLRPITKWTLCGVLGVAAAAGITWRIAAPRQTLSTANVSHNTGVIVANDSWPIGEARVFSAGLRTRVTTESQALADVDLAGAWKLVRIEKPGARPGALRAVAELAVNRLHLATSPDSEPRVRSAYGGCPSCGSSGARTEIIRSRIDLEFTNDSGSPLFLSSVASDEATRVEGGAPLPKMSSETQVTLRLESSAKLDAKALAATASKAHHVRLQAMDNRGLDRRAVLLGSRLAKAATNQDIMEYLRALGNAATPSSLAAVEPYLTHENASVRAAAVNALRRIPGPRVDQYLAAALLDDGSEAVRLSAASAMDYRSSSAMLVAALQKSLDAERERDVRLQATRIAVKWATKETALRDVLLRLAQQDPDKKIREVAGAAG